MAEKPYTLIDINVPTFNIGPIEMILERCCRQYGDTLLSKDEYPGGALYSVLLSSNEEPHTQNHVQVLIPALQRDLLSCGFARILALLEITFREGVDVKQRLREFPLESREGERYTAIDNPSTVYITNTLHEEPTDEQKDWLKEHEAEIAEWRLM